MNTNDRVSYDAGIVGSAVRSESLVRRGSRRQWLGVKDPREARPFEVLGTRSRGVPREVRVSGGSDRSDAVAGVATAPLTSDPRGWHRDDQAASVMIVVGERT